MDEEEYMMRNDTLKQFFRVPADTSRRHMKKIFNILVKNHGWKKRRVPLINPKGHKIHVDINDGDFFHWTYTPELLLESGYTELDAETLLVEGLADGKTHLPTVKNSPPSYEEAVGKT